MKIFSGTANKPLTERIAHAVGLELSPLEIHMFPDGEKRVRVIESVVGDSCVVVQSTGGSPDQLYMETFFIVDALKRSGAAYVTVVLSYLGYQRQDHIFRIGEARSLAVIVMLLEAIGVDRIITFDLHSIKIPSLFRIPVVHLSALTLFAEIIRHNKWNDSKTVLVSPDMGGIRRVQSLSQMLDKIPCISIEKNRNLQSGDVEVIKVNGHVRERAIIVDDMISTGKTIAIAVEALQKRGAHDIIVFATHPVFSDEAIGLLQACVASQIFVTDTIPVKETFPKLTVISVADIVAASLSASSV